MLNQINIMGRLVRDPELRRTANGTAVASFTLAVDRDFGGEDKKTDFIPVVAWKGTAEFASKYFTKGEMAVVTGSLQNRSWTDKNGNKRETAEVIAGSIYFAGTKKHGNENNASIPIDAEFEDLDEDEEELPF